MKDSSSASGSFVDSFASLPDLDVLLHGPALAKSSSAAESTLPVKPLREFVGGVHHLRAPGSSIEGFLSALPSVSAPAADRLVRSELDMVYTPLAAGILQLQEVSGAAGGCAPDLRLRHYCQATFGRLDLAWQTAVQLQQQQQGQQQGSAGQMQVEVSGASLTLTSSADLDDDLIPDDISLPLDVSWGGGGGRVRQGRKEGGKDGGREIPALQAWRVC